MTEISNESPENTSQEPEITYAGMCEQQEDDIENHTKNIFEYLMGCKLSPWSRLEILNNLRILEIDSLGTIINPEGVDVVREDKRLNKVYDEIRKNSEIARSVLDLINSPGYRLRNLSLDQIWQIAEENYW